ncbi:MAG: DUF5686 family protein [Ferruginibacter sp.]
MLFINWSCTVIGQPIPFSGKVTDAHTKESISYASIYFLKAGNGKVTGSSGHFTVFLFNSKSDTLVVSYAGYELYKVAVTAATKDQLLDIQLQRGGNNSGAVVRAKVNKGLFLWKKIMSKKKQYDRYGFGNFGYNAYNKLEVDIKNIRPNKLKKNFILKPFNFIFDNIDSTSEKEPFLPFYLAETVSDYKYQADPKKFYENIAAANTKGVKNESISKLLGVMDQNVNIYSNFVNVMDKDFISPFNDNADNYYNFSVPDTQIINQKKIFHFVFTPKRAGQNTFEGDAWVLGMTYQLQKITLYLGKDANINYIDRISVFQEFVPYNDSIYFLKKDKFFADFTMFGKKAVSFIGRKTTQYRNVVVNDAQIKNYFFDQPIQETVVTSPLVHSYNDAQWDSLRYEQLSKNEQAIYTTIDKLLVMPKFQKLQNAISFIGTGYKNIGNYEIGPWFNWISSNNWEGTRFRFDLGTNTGFHKKMYFHGYLAYGTKDQKFKGKGEAYWIVTKKPNWSRLHVSYTNDIDNGISSYNEVSQDNVFSLAIRKPNISRKFIQVREFVAEGFKEWGKGFSTELFIAQRKFYPLQNLPPLDNFAVTKGEALQNFEIALKFRFAYLEQFVESNYFRYTLGSRYPAVELVAAKAVSKVINSSYDYIKLSGSVSDFMRISPFGTLTYKFYGGKIYGNLPYTYLFIPPANDLYYYNRNSLNLMTRFEYLTDTYAGLNLEHAIGSGVFRYTGITRKLKWRQFWTAKLFYGTLSEANKKINNTPISYFKTLDGKIYSELGTGIDNIFKVFRLDFVWRILPTPLPDNKTSRFGVFGSFQFQF